MSNDLVSVIIPTFARPIRLKKAVDSVTNQTHTELEIIIVDDNDPDSSDRSETRDLVGSIDDKRIKYIEHDRNCGANVARNTGISASNGNYVCFLDDDDVYKKEKIHKQLKAVELVNNENGVLVFTGAQRKGDRIYSKSKWMDTTDDYYFTPSSDLILTKNFIGSNSYVMIDKKSLMKTNGFDTEMVSCQDWDLFIKLSINGAKFIGINEELVIYYDHNEQRITNSSIKRIKGHLQISKKYSDHIEKTSLRFYLDFKKYLFYQFLNIDKDEALKISKEVENKLNKTEKMKWLFQKKVLINISNLDSILNLLRWLKNKTKKSI